MSGWVSLIAVDYIVKKSKLKEDVALAIILSSFYGLGVVLLKYIDKLPGYPDKSGLSNYLFGSATQLVNADLIGFGIVGGLILIVLFVHYKPFKLLSFDPIYSQSIGLNIPYLEFVLTSITVLAVVIGIQTVGVVLMAAMLITPGAIALFWTKNLKYTLLLAALLGVISSWLGCFTSYFWTVNVQGSIIEIPTGPSIVMYLSMFGILSFFFTPKKGILSKYIKKIRFKNQILMDNLLKALYKKYGTENKVQRLCLNEILSLSSLPNTQIKKSMHLLIKDGYLLKKGNDFEFTAAGIAKGKRITKIHRLWELYLITHLNVDLDYVHNDAESIEHILTPEIEKSLEEHLNYPTTDPHNSPIPYK